MLDLKNTVADIVRKDYRTAYVFKKHGINFCCEGRKTLEEACAEGKINQAMIEKELTEASRTISLSHSLPFDQWKVSFLVDYIINVHHAYLHLAIPAMEERLVTFMNKHLNKYPEFANIFSTFHELSIILSAQTENEEKVIFPYIRQIDVAFTRKESYGKLFVRTLRKPLGNVSQEHNIITEHLNKLLSLTKNYSLPDNACTSHKVVYQTLKEFHDDLVQHKHLENNILFPKAIEIETELLLI